MIAVEELRQNASLSPDNPEETLWNAHREFHVTGLSSDDFFGLAEALTAVGIRRGDALGPTPYDATIVTAIDAQHDPESDPVTGHAATVFVDYGQEDDEDGGDSGGGGQEDEVNGERERLTITSISARRLVGQDQLGRTIELMLDGKPAVKKFVEDEDALPVIELSTVRLMTLSQAVALNLQFAGAVNSEPFTMGGETVSERKAYCLPISIEEIDRNVRYRVTVRIAFNPETWDQTLALQLDDGTFPTTDVDDLDEPFAVQRFRIKREVSFTGLFG